MSEASELIFEEPIPDGRKSAFTIWMEALVDHPGKWAKYPEPVSPGSVGNYQRQASKTSFEVTRRTVDALGNRPPEGKLWVYARAKSDAAS